MDNIEKTFAIVIGIIADYFLIKEGVRGLFKGELHLPSDEFPIMAYFIKNRAESIREAKKIRTMEGVRARFWGGLFILVAIIITSSFYNMVVSLLK